ncbi:DICT sensory domain-containing protein [Natrinema gari]|uniref:Putative sensor protein n=1 Tax=Natrinema gari JCM 14663 TaxID=1230459 RepID=L9YQ20_9EURY|nr:DICT sensory domain-containing protein [Natrinema gari]ELY76335.1 putative sensor protein [Natrinema gari JCM 14663]
MQSLRDAFENVDRRRKTLEIHTDEESVIAEFRQQFDTRNVDVTHRPLGAIDEMGFVIVRDSDGEFRGALGLDQFEAVLSPDLHPPWELAERDLDSAALFSFLENTLFSSYDRRQMVATSREIEERAWRVGTGRLYAGFQRPAALRAQTDVYKRFGDRDSLVVVVFLDGEYEGELTDDVTVVTDASGELDAFWFVVFDGGRTDRHRCALVAEEREPGRYYGFWTYDPILVGDLVAYLEAASDGR